MWAEKILLFAIKKRESNSSTKTSVIQPQLDDACFVQSCFAVADFVIFSDYCLIGTRASGGVFCLRVKISNK